MLPYLIIGLVAGLVTGFAAGFLIARSSAQTSLKLEQQRAAQLETTLAQRTSERDSAHRDLESARSQSAAREKEWAERDAALREQNARIAAERSAAEQNAEKAASAIEEMRAANDRLRGDLAESQAAFATLRTTLEAEQKAAQEKLEMLTAARVELSNQFETLANKILEEKSKRFTEQNQANIGNLLNPLKEKFGEFQQKVESLEKENLTGRTELKSQIDQLRNLNERLSQDANNLVTALKGSSKTQGDWGELVLERLLEASGLRKGYEYRTQETFTRQERADDGHLRARLDVIVDLPEGRHIVIDSKVSLNSYNDYCAASDEQAREAALASHLASVRNHIRDLARRDYRSLYQLNSLDFVVMFVPIEPAFTLALASDDKLWEEAWDKNVLLVSRTSLLFVLRTVAHLWRQEQQTKNVQEIVRRGGELYDKLAAFAKDLVDVGKGLDSARASYDEAYKKLATGKGNVIRQAELLRGMGVKPSKAIPMPLVEQALDSDSEPLELAASESENA